MSSGTAAAHLEPPLSNPSSLYSSHEKLLLGTKALSIGGGTSVGGYESDELRVTPHGGGLMRSSTERAHHHHHHRQESHGDCDDETSSQMLDDYCCSSPVSSSSGVVHGTASSSVTPGAGGGGVSSSGKKPRAYEYRRERARSLSCSPSSSMLGCGGGGGYGGGASMGGFGYGIGSGHKNGDEAGANDFVLLQNERFKDIFPEACKQMEENLAKFIEQNRLDLVPQSQPPPAAVAPPHLPASVIALSTESQSDSQSSSSSHKLLQAQNSISSHSSM